jgi:hypothetical protein
MPVIERKRERERERERESFIRTIVHNGGSSENINLHAND